MAQGTFYNAAETKKETRHSIGKQFTRVEIANILQPIAMVNDVLMGDRIIFLDAEAHRDERTGIVINKLATADFGDSYGIKAPVLGNVFLIENVEDFDEYTQKRDKQEGKI